MRKNVIVWIMLAAVAAHTPLKAQYYTLRSSEGKKVRVHVEELHHELRVSCLHDSLLLYEYFGGYDARMLSSDFLQITYRVRGGSGYGSENTAILAVRDGRLCQALLVMSSFDAVGYKYHHTSNTDLKLSVSQGNGYLLTASVREYLRDGAHPAGFHKRYRPFYFRYNKELMAFCSKTAVADSGFIAAEVNQGEECLQFMAGDTIPMIRLARDSYYYAEGSWYSPTEERLYSQQDTVIDKVFRLPVVLQKSAWVDSASHHRHGISLMMLETTDWPSDTGHYVLQAGYHSRHRFDPYYLFKVYQPDLVVRTLYLPR